MLAPTATPAAIIDRLNAAPAKILGLPDVKEQFLRQGVYALPGPTPAKASELPQALLRRYGMADQFANSRLEPVGGVPADQPTAPAMGQPGAMRL